MDPAGPNFEDNSPNAKNRLEGDDADFVDIIHGDAGFYGVNCSIGMADFWPNNGTRTQRGCPPTNAPISQNENRKLDRKHLFQQRKHAVVIFSNNFIDPCSHVRPVLYFIESVRNTAEPKRLDFYAAKRYFNGTMSANETDIVRMGINCPTTARGSYYLATDAKSPFSIGINGIK